MNQEAIPTHSPPSEFAEMRNDINRILQYIEREEAQKKKAEDNGFIQYQMPIRAKVTKYEVADILMVSPRQVQRIRHKIGLKWEREGRETFYHLKDLVEAIKKHQRNWNPVAYEKAVKRITRIPRYTL